MTALDFLVIFIILLGNFTAPNPTGRRYASEITIRSGGTQQVGAEAERVLANDLNVVNNNTVGQCICREAGAHRAFNNCTSCFVVNPAISSTTRQPDFVTRRYIADAKNTVQLRDLRQIEDFARAAEQLRVPLYIYSRVDTFVPARIQRVVDETGGDVVPYFRPDGWVDPVDRLALRGSLVAVVVIVLMLAWEVLARRRPYPETPPPERRTKGDDIAGELARMKERTRQRIEAEDSRLEQ